MWLLLLGVLDLWHLEFLKCFELVKRVLEHEIGKKLLGKTSQGLQKFVTTHEN